MTYQTACVEAFKAEIAPFVGTAPTAHNVVAANNIINNFTGRLQLGDLTLRAPVQRGRGPRLLRRLRQRHGRAHDVELGH